MQTMQDVMPFTSPRAALRFLPIAGVIGVCDL
jgi:hypothetical protein